MTVPYPEVVGAPLQLYLAPFSSPPVVFPKIQAAPIAPWVKIGTNGFNNYDSAGVTVTHNQTIAPFTPVGTTAPIKMWRTDESLEIAIVLADISIAAYSAALNNAAISTIVAASGVAGESDMPLLQGIQVATFALLARGLSPFDPTFNAQYAVPCVYQSANPAPVFKKGAPAELALTYTTLLDPNGGGFGELQYQSAAAL